MTAASSHQDCHIRTSRLISVHQQDMASNVHMLYGESERHLFALVQSGAVSQQAGQTADQILISELGPIDMTGAQPMQGPPDQLFLGLEHQLRSLVQAKALSEAGFGSIYALMSEERGNPCLCLFTECSSLPSTSQLSLGWHLLPAKCFQCLQLLLCEPSHCSSLSTAESVLLVSVMVVLAKESSLINPQIGHCTTQTRLPSMQTC